MAPSVEAVLPRICSTVGESPHWEIKQQRLTYVDIRSGDIHQWHPDTKQHHTIHFGGQVGFALPRSSGGYIMGLGPTLCEVDLEAGKIVDQFVSVDAFRFNDGKCDPSGRLWTGTLGDFDHQRALYCLDADRRLKCCLDQLQLPNGMAWDEEKRLMYLVDTAPRQILCLDYEAATGEVGGRRVCIDFDRLGPEVELGRPDGLCLDTDGHLWVACFGGGVVICLDAVTQQERTRVSIAGARQITSCCFGGPDLSELYVTSANSRLSALQAKAQPLAGSLFKVTGLGVKGHPGSMFRG